MTRQTLSVLEQFQQSIRCGTGRCILLQRNHPTTDFSAYILDAVLNHYAYDPQSEGHRAVYLHLLIKECSQKNKIIEDVITALEKENTDSWKFEQLLALACEWAIVGNKKARGLIHQRFRATVTEKVHWGLQEAILQLEGQKGWLQIAKLRGKAIANGKLDFDDLYFADFMAQEYPDLSIWETVESAAASDDYIHQFFTFLSSKKKPPLKQKTVFSYDYVKENIAKGRKVPIGPGGIKKLNKQDLQRLASDFLRESNALNQEKYLRIFAHTPFPKDYSTILEIAKNPNPKGTRLVEYACKSLQYFQAAPIRALAIQKLTQKNPPPDYLYLLVGNYKIGDAQLLLNLITQHQGNEHNIHDLIWGLVDIYKANMTSECLMPMMTMYNQLTCGIHRYDIVKIMLDNNVLPENIHNEIAFDSYEQTRVLSTLNDSGSNAN